MAGTRWEIVNECLRSGWYLVGCKTAAGNGGVASHGACGWASTLWEPQSALSPTALTPGRGKEGGGKVTPPVGTVSGQEGRGIRVTCGKHHQ